VTANNVYERFAATVARGGDRPAVEVQRRDRLETYTYAELDAMAQRCAAWLGDQGLAVGDRCGILAGNDAHWCAAYLGILRIGAVAVPLDTTYNATQVARLLGDSGASMLLTTQKFLPVVHAALPRLSGECRVALLHPATEPTSCPVLPLTPARPAESVPRAVGPAVVGREQPAVILYTSGTTSDPKGVVLTHGNLLGEIECVFQVIDVDERDGVLGVLPLFHALAQMANLLLPFAVGARVVFLETVNTTELMRALGERQISAFCCVPQFFYLIHQRVFEHVAKASLPRRWLFRGLLSAAGTLRERLGINVGRRLFGRVHRALGPRMRLLVTGGSRFDPRIGRDLYRLGFNILQAYGLTETSGAATVLRPGDRHVGSVGQPLPGVELKIVPAKVGDAEGAGPAAEGGGEIVIRGPIVMPGYYRRADANMAAFRDGWFHTGDLGYLDNAGRVYVTGRAKEVIVLSSGKNIYPEEIEAHYAQSPYIAELCVMGRSDPDQPSAERLHAIVVPDFDVLRERKIVNAREVLRFDIEALSVQLPGHQRILSYDIVSEPLPRTTTRKLKRFEIERIYGQASTPTAVSEEPPPAGEDERAWATDAHVSQALEVLREATQREVEIRPGANLELDLGFDSMERVELLTRLEARFGVTVADEVASRIYTVRELVEAVRPVEGAAAAAASAAADPWAHLLSQVREDDPAFASLLVPRPLMTAVMFVVFRVVHAAAWLLLGLRVSGREHLPAHGPFLISPNHQSFLDVFLLIGTLPYRVFRELFFVGASEYFTGRFRERLARSINVIPVDPDTNLVRAMQAGAYGLRHGKALVLFPEGERSIDGEVKRFKKGAAILAMHLDAPIVPVALHGIFDLWPRGRGPRWWALLPFSGARVRVAFGPPVMPLSERSESGYATITEQLHAAVVEMFRSLPTSPAAS